LVYRCSGWSEKTLKGVSSKNKELNNDIMHFREIVLQCRIILVINNGCNGKGNDGGRGDGTEESRVA
jgi:hypothetical protein